MYALWTYSTILAALISQFHRCIEIWPLPACELSTQKDETPVKPPIRERQSLYVYIRVLYSIFWCRMWGCTSMESYQWTWPFTQCNMVTFTQYELCNRRMDMLHFTSQEQRFCSLSNKFPHRVCTQFRTSLHRQAKLLQPQGLEQLLFALNFRR